VTCDLLLQRLTRVIANALDTPDGPPLQARYSSQIAHCTSHLTQRLADDVAADAGLVRAYEEQVLLRKAETIFGYVAGCRIMSLSV